jgi:hypothetical protein
MTRNTATIAAAVMGAALLTAGSAIQPARSQTITFGPNGVQVRPDTPPDRHRDYHHDEDDLRDRHRDEYYGPRWREVRHRMMEYRDGCRRGDRGACVRLGIIIGQNQDRRDDWRREHPDYFWWDRY